MKHILIKSEIEGIKTEDGIINLTDTVLNLIDIKADNQNRVRVITELFKSESAIDSEGLPLVYDKTEKLSFDYDNFIALIIPYVCQKLKSNGYEVENLLLKNTEWAHPDKTIRVFLTNSQVNSIAFSANYAFIVSIHTNNLTFIKTKVGSWLYLSSLSVANTTLLEDLGAYIENKI